MFKKFDTSKKSIQVIYSQTVFSRIVLILQRPTHHLLYFSLSRGIWGARGNRLAGNIPKCICQVPSASSPQGAATDCPKERWPPRPRRTTGRAVGLAWEHSQGQKDHEGNWGGFAQAQWDTTGGKTGDYHATISWNYLHILLSSSQGIQLFSKCHPGWLLIFSPEESLVLPPDHLHYVSIINCIFGYNIKWKPSMIFFKPDIIACLIRSRIISPTFEEHSFLQQKLGDCHHPWVPSEAFCPHWSHSKEKKIEKHCPGLFLVSRPPVR